MKKLTRKQIDSFNNEVIEILEHYNTTKIDDNKYTLNSTKLGLLIITLDRDISSIYTIYCRFEEPEKAMNHFNVTSYNGKMNTHSYNKEECLYHLDSLLYNYYGINGIKYHDIDDLPFEMPVLA